MRKWMRERMKRRKKPSEELPESTGKVGQAIDRSKPAPLVPSLIDDVGEHSAAAPPQRSAPGSHRHKEAPAEPAPSRAAEPARHGRRSEAAHARQAVDAGGEGYDREPAEAQAEGRMVIETQPESPNTPPAADATGRSSAKRPPRGVVVLAIGLPGSGKTTWFKRRGVTPLSSDMLRTILFDNITEQRYQGLVFSTLRSLLRARLIAKMPWNYVDATNLSPHERRQWIKMSRSFGYDVQAVFFDVPLEVCLERNRKRERQVSEEVMQQMSQRLKPPTFKEGFSKIVVVRVKAKESEM